MLYLAVFALFSLLPVLLLYIRSRSTHSEVTKRCTAPYSCGGDSVLLTNGSAHVFPTPAIHFPTRQALPLFADPKGPEKIHLVPTQKEVKWVSPQMAKEQVRQARVDHTVRTCREGILFLLALVVVALLLIKGLDLVGDPNASIEAKQLGTGVITIILGGVVGFLLGRRK